MPSIALFNRRDPWWDTDGAAARSARRRHRLVGFAAFVVSLLALAGAGAGWALQLGLLPGS